MTNAAHPARILVTGGTGFLGRACVERLLSQGHDVHVVSRGKPRHAGASWSRCDVLDIDSVRDLVRDVRPSALLHLAWSADEPFANGLEYQGSQEHDEWFAASQALFDIFGSTTPQGRIVAAGTAAEYGAPDAPSLEDAPVAGLLSSYARNKRKTMAALEHVAHDRELTWAWGRIFHLYGGGSSPRRVITRVARALLKRERVHCPPSTYRRDFVFVPDAAEVLLRLLERPPNEAVNVGTGIGYTVQEVLLEVAHLIGRPELLDFDAPVPESLKEEARVLVADVTRERAVTGFVPPTSITEGLTRTIDYLRTHEGLP